MEQVKTKLCQALDNKKTSKDIRILADGRREGEYINVEDVKSLQNNDLVYFVYLQENGTKKIANAYVICNNLSVWYRPMGDNEYYRARVCRRRRRRRRGSSDQKRKGKRQSLNIGCHKYRAKIRH